MTEERGEYGVKIIDKRIPVGEETRIVPQSDNAFLTLFQIAAQKGYDPEFISKMMDLQERHEAITARKAFFEALSAFKAEAPPVTKDKENRQFGSKYTSLGNLLDTYNPILGKHGLTLSFPPCTQTESSMTVEGRLSHSLGHSESMSMTGPIDESPIGRESGRAARNPLQNIKSTFTYLRSAICEAILGVAGTEATADDDGNGADKYITDEQKKTIEDLIKERAVDKVKFLKLSNAESVETILAEKYNKAVAWLKACPKPKKEREPGEDG